jgi:hypothetical protein
MNTNFSKISSKAPAIASLLAGGAVAGSFIACQPTQAQNANSARVTVTNILSNGNTVTFGGQVLMPEADRIVDGNVTLAIGYVTSVSAPDNVILSSATLNVGNVTANVQSVAAATARSIDAAIALTRFGDIIGIVEGAAME